MSIILSLETATEVCSVALSVKNNIVSSKTVTEKNVHSAQLTILIKEIVTTAGIKFENIDAVAVSKGPGSFTGLRIGVAVAKGICFALDKPLLAVNTLKAMAWDEIKKNKDSNLLYCPLIDAKNTEVYYALYEETLEELIPTNAGLIDESTFKDHLKGKRIVLLMNGKLKGAEFAENLPEFQIIDNIIPDAGNISELAFEKYNKHEFEDISVFEPFYLRDFKARFIGKKVHDILYRKHTN